MRLKALVKHVVMVWSTSTLIFWIFSQVQPHIVLPTRFQKRSRPGPWVQAKGRMRAVGSIQPDKMRGTLPWMILTLLLQVENVTHADTHTHTHNAVAFVLFSAVQLVDDPRHVESARDQKRGPPSAEICRKRKLWLGYAIRNWPGLFSLLFPGVVIHQLFVSTCFLFSWGFCCWGGNEMITCSRHAQRVSSSLMNSTQDSMFPLPLRLRVWDPCHSIHSFVNRLCPPFFPKGYERKSLFSNARAALVH